MATTAARITGSVAYIGQERSGKSKASESPYRIQPAGIVVGNHGIAEVTLDLLGANTPRVAPGDLIDWAVQVSSYSGEPSFRYLGEWEDNPFS